VSSVTINHATPAAFYSHFESRNEYYDIALQLAESNFDYFGAAPSIRLQVQRRIRQAHMKY
jgi:alkaline phosphatase